MQFGVLENWGLPKLIWFSGTPASSGITVLAYTNWTPRTFKQHLAVWLTGEPRCHRRFSWMPEIQPTGESYVGRRRRRRWWWQSDQ